MKDQSLNFYAIQHGLKEFQDSNFPHDDEALVPSNHRHNLDGTGSSRDLSAIVDNSSRGPLEWTQSIDLRHRKGASLFGSSDSFGDSTDIYQGLIGNCWFMHGASAVAREPQRLRDIFYNDDLSNRGVYALRFYVLGIPTTIIIDDWVPLNKFGGTVFAGVDYEDPALWGILIEKAFAKLHGNWEAIIAGDPRHSINVLTGAPAENYYHGSCPAGNLVEGKCLTGEVLDESTVFSTIKNALDNGNMVSGSTPSDSDNSNTSALGVV